MIHIHKDRGTGLWHLDQEHGTSDDYATWGEAIEDADYLIATGRRAQEQRQAAEQRTARRKARILERRMARAARREGELA
ncbi:hypothetical protein ACT3S7_06250 [Corynebacterium sp. AOP34-AQ2-28]|uniref:hypothetical protein n=1 Tax=unclassified Corynebacterium TaxID=2624378 RepID=UPI002655578B|nr:hypothetical protein [Brachybacterium sp.]